MFNLIPLSIIYLICSMQNNGEGNQDFMIDDDDLIISTQADIRADERFNNIGFFEFIDANRRLNSYDKNLFFSDENQPESSDSHISIPAPSNSDINIPAPSSLSDRVQNLKIGDDDDDDSYSLLLFRVQNLKIGDDDDSYSLLLDQNLITGEDDEAFIHRLNNYDHSRHPILFDQEIAKNSYRYNQLNGKQLIQLFRMNVLSKKKEKIIMPSVEIWRKKFFTCLDNKNKQLALCQKFVKQ